MALFNTSICRNRAHKTEDKKKSTNKIIWRPVKEYNLIHLQRKLRNYSAYTEAGRKVTKKNFIAWKSLADLSVNSTRKPQESKNWRRSQRAPKTHSGCSVCRIPFCIDYGLNLTLERCWNEHLTRLNTKDQLLYINLHTIRLFEYPHIVRSSHHSAKISGQREPPIGRLLSINCGRKPSCQGIPLEGIVFATNYQSGYPI